MNGGGQRKEFYYVRFDIKNILPSTCFDRATWIYIFSLFLLCLFKTENIFYICMNVVCAHRSCSCMNWVSDLVFFCVIESGFNTSSHSESVGVHTHTQFKQRKYCWIWINCISLFEYSRLRRSFNLIMVANK